MKTKQCVILAGGYGSRLGVITNKIPKPLLKINKIPFLFYLILKLKRSGIKNIIILVWNKSDEFNKINFKKKFNLNIKIIKEPKKLGTGGSLINSYKYLDKNFFLVNGDTLFDISLKKLEEYFFKHSHLNLITACCYNTQKSNKFAYFFDKKENLINYKISKYSNKWISGGIYILRRKILKSLKISNIDFDKKIVFSEFKKSNLGAKKYNNKFIDIGTKEDLIKAKKIIPKIIKKTKYLIQ